MLEERFCSLVNNTSSDYLYKAPIPQCVSFHKCWGHWNFPGTNNHTRSTVNPGHHHHNGGAVGSKGCKQRCQEDPLLYSFTFQAAACTNTEQLSNTARDNLQKYIHCQWASIHSAGTHTCPLSARQKRLKALTVIKERAGSSSSKEVYSQTVDVLRALHSSAAPLAECWTWQSGQQGKFLQNFRRVSVVKRDNSQIIYAFLGLKRWSTQEKNNEGKRKATTFNGTYNFTRFR